MESGDQATYAETSSYEPHGELRRLKVEGEGGLGVFGLPSLPFRYRELFISQMCDVWNSRRRRISPWK